MNRAKPPKGIFLMPRPSVRVACLVLFAAVLSASGPARAADVVVLTAGAFKPALLDLTPGYEAVSRDTVVVSNDTAGGVAARVARGEEMDLVIMPAPALEALTAQGRIVAGTVVVLARSGIGVAVKNGAPAPNIGTVEAFKQAMLAAPSVAYIDPASGGSSGIYIAKLFDKLGIAAAMSRTSVLVPGGLVGSRVDNGEAVLGLQQISELRVVSGVTVAGPLPEEIQNYTVYAAGIPKSARRPRAGEALLAYLRSEAGTKALLARGLSSP